MKCYYRNYTLMLEKFGKTSIHTKAHFFCRAAHELCKLDQFVLTKRCTVSCGTHLCYFYRLRTRIAKPAPAQTSMLGGGAQGDGWSSGSASSASSALLQKSVNELTARVDNLEENQQRSLRKVERVMDLAYTFLVAVLVLLMAAVAHLTNVYRFDTWL